MMYGAYRNYFQMMQVIYKPFSNIYKGLQSKTAIQNFFKVSIMANEGLKKTISFEDNKEESITAIVIFECGDSIKGIHISLCD